MEVQIAISYGQLCVFDPALDAPYNDWGEGHVAQGFSWRPGSVSFATVDNVASAVVHVICSSAPPITNGAAGAIRVPLDVSTRGLVEIGSIASGVEVSLPAGSYALYFLEPQTVEDPFRLVFVPMDDVCAAVLQEGEHARKQDRYLMTAKPAQPRSSHI